MTITRRTALTALGMGAPANLQCNRMLARLL